MRYCDVSFLAPLFLEEALSRKVEAWVVRQTPGDLCVSHWTRTEFSSLIAREVRMGGLTEADALKVIVQFDRVIKDCFVVEPPRVSDFDLAATFIRQFNTKLRAGDALHLAIAANRATGMFYTLDERLLAAARRLKIPASRGIRR